MTQVKFYGMEEIRDSLILYVVSAARYDGKWVFSRHKSRSTWDMPGGHREAGETLLQSMNRELWEETGAQDAKNTPVAVYSVTKQGKTTYGMLFFSEIFRLGTLPENFEMAQIRLTDRLPKELTYPDIQPELFFYIQDWMNLQFRQLHQEGKL